VAVSLRELGFDDPMRLLASYCFRIADIRDELRAAPLNLDDKPRLEFTAPRSHLVNTVKENLGWLRSRLRDPAPFIDLPASWSADDERRSRLMARLQVLREAQRLTIDGRLQVLAGDLEGGIASIEKGVSTDPADPYARDMAARNLVKLAERFYAQGKREASRRAYERSLQWDPKHFLALYNLARFAWEDGDAALARRLTDEGLAQAPHSPSLNYRMGLLLYDAGDLSGAERSLLKALDEDPVYPEPMMVLGDIHRARKEADRAAVMYQRAIEVGKKDAEAFAAVAQALVDGGQAPEAAVWAGKAIAMAPRDPEALFARARVAAAQQRAEDARHDLDEAVKAGGDRIRARARHDPLLAPFLGAPR